MLLGCNYSKELIKLISDRKVKVDYIKLGLYEMYEEGFEVSRKLSPVLLHGVGGSIEEHAGMESIDSINWQSINNAVKHFNSPHLGFHLFSTTQDWNGEIVSDDKVVNRMIEVTKVWTNNICVPFLIENLPYYLNSGHFPCVSEPNVIKTVCNEANVGLLLDIAHARVAASNRQEDIFSYLTSLPLDRVKEIHVVGVQETENDGLRDSHLEMQEEDYSLLKWTLERTKPHVVTLEYGGPGSLFEWRSDIEVLERQLVRLMKICESN